MAKTKKRAAKKARVEEERGDPYARPGSFAASKDAQRAQPVGPRLAAVTAALQAGTHHSALELLEKVARDGQRLRLGSLQRWVHLLDSCLAEDPARLQVLHALLHLQRNPAALGCPGVVRLRYEPWEAPVPKATAAPKAKLPATRLALETAGRDRQPPNLHPLRIYALSDAAFPPADGLERVAHPVPGVASAHLVTGVLSAADCATLVACGDKVGYTPDEPVEQAFRALGPAFVWQCPPQLLELIFDRLKDALPAKVHVGEGVPNLPGEDVSLLGLNGRFRSSRHDGDCVHRPNIDSASADGKDRRSRYSVLLYLNDDYEGGRTTFLGLPESGTEVVAQPVAPLRGAALVWPHGEANAPVYEDGAVRAGVKYVARTEALYAVPAPTRQEAPTQEILTTAGMGSKRAMEMSKSDREVAKKRRMQLGGKPRSW